MRETRNTKYEIRNTKHRKGNGVWNFGFRASVLFRLSSFFFRIFPAPVRAKRGQTLVEILVVIAVFAIVAVGVLPMLLGSIHATKQGVEYVAAAGYVQEGLAAARTVRDRDWEEVSYGTHGLDTSSGVYAFAGSSDAPGQGFTRTVTVEQVYRSGGLGGDIAQTGLLDPNTKKITVNVAWEVATGRRQNLDSVFYVHRFDTSAWTQTTLADFNLGENNSTRAVSTGNGAIELGQGDRTWQALESVYTMDLEGTGDRIALYADRVRDILYVLSTNTTGPEFLAYDISNVSNAAPVLVGSVELSTQATDLAVVNGYAYVSTSDTGRELIVIDLSRMQAVKFFDVPGNDGGRAVAAMGDTLLFVRGYSDSWDELEYYDLADPANPTLAFSANFDAWVTDVVMDDLYVYASIANMTEEFGVSRRGDGREMGRLDLPGGSGANTLALYGEQVYIGRNNEYAPDLIRVDVSDPAALRITAELELGLSVTDVDVDERGAYAILSTRHPTQEAILVDLNTFSVRSTYDTVSSDDALSTTMVGNHIYLGHSNDTRDLWVLGADAGGWDAPVRIGEANVPATADPDSLVVVGNFAYVGLEANASGPEFFIYDVSLPAAPVLLGSLEIGARVLDIAVQGDYAYLSTSHDTRELDIINISTKSSPVRAGSYNAPGVEDGLSVALGGGLAFLSRIHSSQEELVAIRISPVSAPARLGGIHATSHLNKIVHQGNHVFGVTGDGEEFVVWDVSNPATIRRVGSYNAIGTAFGNALDISGTLVGLVRNTNAEGGLVLLSVANPASPVLLSENIVGAVSNTIAFEGTQVLYLGTNKDAESLQRWNITDPTRPIKETVVNLGDDTRAIVPSGGYAYLGVETDTRELQIYGPYIGAGDYAVYGTFTSQPFDTGSTSRFDRIEWTTSGVGQITLRMRTAATLEDLASARWVGPDGTEESSYAVSGARVSVDALATGTRWVQWKAYFVSDGEVSPVLEEVRVYY